MGKAEIRVMMMSTKESHSQWKLDEIRTRFFTGAFMMYHTT
jgi:hypothetical protein